MHIYFAPLEGITGYAYRCAHQSLFPGIDKYFTPFVAPNYTHCLKTREREDIIPANNKGMPLVPQILSNRPEDFLWVAGEMYAMGYREVNLNLGCPMPTVIRKHRGAGQLGDLDALDRFLEKICEGMGREYRLTLFETDEKDRLRFTVKTRIGIENTENVVPLTMIYNRYPIAELTVHPRTQKDLYGGEPDLEAFAKILEMSEHPVVYNGDIRNVEDYQRISSSFPKCAAIMIGRGLISNPALAREIQGGEPLCKEELRGFHDAVFVALEETLPGPAPLLGKMKELWFYMGSNFVDSDRLLKEIRKARTIVQYQAAVRTLFIQGDFRVDR